MEKIERGWGMRERQGEKKKDQKQLQVNTAICWPMQEHPVCFETEANVFEQLHL